MAGGAAAEGERGGRQATATAAGPLRGTRGFQQQRGVAVTAPALSAQRGVLRDVLVILDLQNGIRFSGQYQMAKVVLVALEQVFHALMKLPYLSDECSTLY